VCIGTLLAARGVLGLVRPDGQLHVERLALARGEAVFIRGPTGRTVLVAKGRIQPPSLLREVAGHLAVWEHKLDAAVQLDAASERALALALARYPADEHLVPTADKEQHVDLGGGAALDISVPDGRVSVSYAPSRPRSDLTTSGARRGSAD
jgi:hypothetical protein